MNKITILLVDDHKLIRDSWSFVLNSDRRFRVIADTNSGREAIKMAKNLGPNIVLMDVNMTPINGFDATRLIRRSSPGSKVIGMTMHTMPAYAKLMLKNGAMGYVTKNSSKEEMMTAIAEVNKGKKYICKEVKNILSRQEIEDEGNGKPDMNVLSRRELEIVKLIREGAPSKEIAVKLDICLKTVEVHRYHILKKLGFKNTASMLNFINKQGFVN